MKSLKLILALLSLGTLLFINGCDEGNYLEAERIERQVLTTTPYLVNVFDCTERANMAKAYLLEKGFKVYNIVQVSPDKNSDKTHDCVGWEKDGEKGTILCLSGWRYFDTGKLKL